MPASRKEREQEPMAPMSEDQLRKARLKARDAMMRLALWKLREMRDKYVGRPRTTRLAKSLRAQIAAAGHRAGGAQDSRAGGAQTSRAEGAQTSRAEGAQTSRAEGAQRVVLEARTKHVPEAGKHWAAGGQHRLQRQTKTPAG